MSRTAAWLPRRQRHASALEVPSGTRAVLHVGCGPRDHEALHESFRGPEWHEVRLDIDPGVKPDVVASITDMAVVPSRSMDAVWSQHNIEHIFAHEVALAFAEFLRVLRPGGHVLVATPDLRAVAAVIATGRLETTLYHADVGPITALDIVYGLRSDIAKGREYMAHRTGFTGKTLAGKLTQAGFVSIRVESDSYALWATAYRPAS